MSNSRDFDYFSQKILDASVPKDGLDEAEWNASLQRWLRMVFRAGSIARVEHGYRKLDDTAMARMLWLVEQGILSTDLKILLQELQDYRDRENALMSNYGVTDADIRSMLGEGFHTGFRKAVDHPYATTIWQLIKDLPGEDWSAVLDFVSEPIIHALREAQRAAEKEVKSSES